MESSWSKPKPLAKRLTRRWIGNVAVLLVCLVSPFSGASAVQRDAATVLAEMRQAIGGDAALDALKTFSARGSRTLSSPSGSRRVALEWFAMLPDHFLEVRRDSPPGPISMDIIYYSGLAGSRPIQKTDARGGPPFPETKYVDNSAAAVAARERARLLHHAQTYSRILLVFTGTASTAFPLQVAYAGVESAEGKTYDVLDASGADGFKCRLHVDAVTHLPAMLTWPEELPTVMTTTQVMTTTTVVRVPSGSPMPTAPPAALPPAPPPATTGTGPRGIGLKRWLFKDFKVQNGIKWPRVIEEEFDNKKEEIRLGQVTINPNIDARKFDVK